MKSSMLAMSILTLALKSVASNPICAATAANEIGSPFIQNYTPSDYGSEAHNQNWDAAQDQLGLMYFANQNGLLVFDGVYWQLVRVANNLPVRSLDVNRDNIVYIGSASELGYLAPDVSGKLTYHSLLQHIPREHKQFGLIYYTFATEHGTSFVTNDSVYFWDGNTMVVHSIPKEPGQVVNVYCHEVYDRIYCVDISARSKLYALSAGRFEDITAYLNPENLPPLSILPYPGGKAVLFFLNGNTVIFDPNRLSAQPTKAIIKIERSLTKQVADYLKTNRTYRHTKNSGERFFFNTLDGGVLVLDAQGRFQRAINTNAGLLENTITSVFVDRDFNLWATSTQGVSHIEISSPISLFDQRNNLESIVTSFQRHQGTLYFGTLVGLAYLPIEAPLENVYKRDILKIGNAKGDCFALIERNHALFAVLNHTGVHQIQGKTATKVFDFPFIALDFCESSRFPNSIFLNPQEGGMVII